jgi:hypothetical protein
MNVESCIALTGNVGIHAVYVELTMFHFLVIKYTVGGLCQKALQIKLGL